MLSVQASGTNWELIQEYQQTNKPYVCKQTNQQTTNVAGFYFNSMVNITYIKQPLRKYCLKKYDL